MASFLTFAILITIYPYLLPAVAFTIIKSFDNKLYLSDSKIPLLKCY